MAISGDGILEATFDPEWATVGLIADGGMWPSAVTSISISRHVPGEPAALVRGVDRRTAVGGYFIGSDPEAPLNSEVTYAVDGFNAAGSLVKSAHVMVATSGAADGAWIKVAGNPNATVRAVARSVSDVESTTQGGVYDIVGGAGVAVGAASGTNADRFSLVVGSTSREQDDALRRTLGLSRILLVQSGCGDEPFDSGWYFVQSVSRALRDPAAILPGRNYTLSLVATGVPSGAGQGIAGVSWESVISTYGDWEHVTDDVASWFALGRGA